MLIPSRLDIVNVSPVHYKHFNYKVWDKNMPAFTVAYRFLGTGDGSTMEIAVARCSKRDSFNKKTGRELALARLVKGDCKEVRPPRVDGKLYKFGQFMNNLINDEILTLINRHGETEKVRL